MEVYVAETKVSKEAPMKAVHESRPYTREMVNANRLRLQFDSWVLREGNKTFYQAVDGNEYPPTVERWTPSVEKAYRNR